MKKIKIIVIHKSQIETRFIPKFITEHNNLDSITVVYLIIKIIAFLILNTYIEATYYRLFIDEYLDNSIEEVIFQFSIICNIDMPLIKDFEAQNSSFSCSLYWGEFWYKTKNSNSSGKYFNGFLLIMYELEKQRIKENLLTNLENSSINFDHWDQDLLIFIWRAISWFR